MLTVNPAYADEKERLLAGIAGSDTAARVEARQLLPRYEMDVVPELVTLMNADDAVVWRAAKNVLADISHRLGTPGREDERHELASMLMEVCLNDGPHHARKHALRLLGIAAPNDFRLGKLKNLAKEEMWREEVISALVVVGSASARNVLRDLLSYGTGAQRAEVIEALRLVTPPPEAPVHTRLLLSDEVEVRVATMRALAQTGNVELADVYPRAIVGTEGRLRVEAVDAYLRLARSLTRDAESKVVARSIFRWVLDTEQDDGLRAGAEAGLKSLDR